MSNETPAEHFARVKVAFPAWRISRTPPDAAVPGVIAIERSTGRRIMAATVTELETRLLSQVQ
jgi:hypothetical protein